MSTLVSRILLTIFMLPVATLVYLLTFVGAANTRGGDDLLNFLAGGFCAWAFISLYWILLWRTSVRWSRLRVLGTLLAAFVSIIVGILSGISAQSIAPEGEFGALIASIATPLVWLIGTVFLWRDTAVERAARVRSPSAIACPACGYNLTGLHEARCPECGQQFTLDELLLRQAPQIEPALDG